MSKNKNKNNYINFTIKIKISLDHREHIDQSRYELYSYNHLLLLTNSVKDPCSDRICSPV